MLIRLRAPINLRLARVIHWTQENRVPVIFREVRFAASFDDIIEDEEIRREYYDGIFSRHGFEVVSRNFNDRKQSADLPYQARAQFGLCRFQILARPEDEVLLAVRFGLKRDANVG